MMNSRHLSQYKGNFFIMDEVLIANLSPTKALVTRMGFQIVPFSFIAWTLLYRCYVIGNNLKAIIYESTSLDRIVADKSHRVIVALEIQNFRVSLFSLLKV